MKSIVFVLTRFNKTSIKALCASLEKGGVPRESVFFVKEPSELSPIPGERLVVFSFTTPFLRSKADWLKGFFSHKKPGDIFIAGGPHPSGDPKGTVSFGFDCSFVGEGEAGFLEVALRFMDGKDIQGVKGLYVPGGRVSKGERVSLDDYPAVSRKFDRMGAVEITRGCPFGCKFCQTSYLFGKKPRHRGIDNILDGVETMVSSGIKDIRFISPDAFSYGGSAEGVWRLLEEVRKLVGKRARVYFGSFPSEVRPESVSDEVLEAVKRFCDSRKIGIGAQTGSDRLLELIGRGHTKEDVLRAVRKALGWGFEIYVDFIFGLPYETEKDELETLEFIERLASMGAKIHGHTFMPLPGTPFSRKAPGRLSERVKRLMGSLASKGLAFGSWDYQERLFK